METKETSYSITFALSCKPHSSGGYNFKLSRSRSSLACSMASSCMRSCVQCDSTDHKAPHII
ncbi:hypothetical protein BDZ94DRAFT_1269239 [Collybia nuda]|uniref:Uncharacterized protein n=1 Tax=Collybia nuda TaxID=64659 RepID=A0A9P5Y0G4_9AGAR|nr:hypothetical protein BDZ94DRAFT_1269239 [Collybia nuda]